MAFCGLCGTKVDGPNCRVCGSPVGQIVPPSPAPTPNPDYTAPVDPTPTYPPVDPTLTYPPVDPTLTYPPVDPTLTYPPRIDLAKTYPAQPYPPQTYPPQTYPPQANSTGPLLKAQSPATKSRVPMVVGIVTGIAAALVVAVVGSQYFAGLGSTSLIAQPTAVPTVTLTRQVVVPHDTGTSTQGDPAASTQANSPAAQIPPQASASVWVTVLASLDKNQWTVSQAAARRDATATAGHIPFLMDSTATQGMNPGYWVVADGSFSSEADALATCAAYGRQANGGECYARHVVFSAGSLPTETPTSSTLQQECVTASALNVAGCTAANDFVTRYAGAEKSVTLTTIADWWIQPASYYGLQLDLAALQPRLVKPTASGTVYLPGKLAAYQEGATDGGLYGTRVDLLVPYKRDGVLKTVTVTYLLVPAGGANPYRIARVHE